MDHIAHKRYAMYAEHSDICIYCKFFRLNFIAIIEAEMNSFESTACTLQQFEEIMEITVSNRTLQQLHFAYHAALAQFKGKPPVQFQQFIVCDFLQWCSIYEQPEQEQEPQRSVTITPDLKQLIQEEIRQALHEKSGEKNSRRSRKRQTDSKYSTPQFAQLQLDKLGKAAEQSNKKKNEQNLEGVSEFQDEEENVAETQQKPSIRRGSSNGNTSDIEEEKPERKDSKKESLGGHTSVVLPYVQPKRGGKLTPLERRLTEVQESKELRPVTPKSQANKRPIFRIK